MMISDAIYETSLAVPKSELSANFEFQFILDPRITEPESFRVAFVIFLDGDLVMTPEHVGIGLMVAVLRRAGYTCCIFEVPYGTTSEVARTVTDWKPNLVCCTLMSLNLVSCMDFCNELDILLPEARIACGGPAITFGSKDILDHLPMVDVLAIGEGEPTIFNLVQCLYLGDSLSMCPGIVYRDQEGKLVHTPLLQLMHNLDDLPFAARDQFEMHGELEYIRLSTSRGCVAYCSFCSAPNVGNRLQKGKAWRGRSSRSVLDEIKYLVEKYSFRTFDFIDSTFEDPDGGRIGKMRVRAIALGLLERKLDVYYNCCMRAENWSDDDHELLDILVRSGLEKVNVGIESGVAEELLLWKKRATVDDNIRIIRLLSEHRIYLAMGFIPFHPYSTMESLCTNAEFLRNVYGGHNLRRMTERLEVYPGTRIAVKLEEAGLLSKDFHRTQNPYGYRYLDERVQKLAEFFASLYNNHDYYERGVITEESAVFQFETFNVVVETFMTRIYRRFRNREDTIEQLNSFRDIVLQQRSLLAEFNYMFFQESLQLLLEDRLNDFWRKRKIAEINTRFRTCIDFIKKEQLRFGMSLIRTGIDLGQLKSKSLSKCGAPRTYTGGAPCW